MRASRRSVFACLLLSAHLAVAASDSVIDLSTAYQQALYHDPQRAGALETLRADEQLRPIAVGQLLPHIQLTAEETRRRIASSFAFIPITRTHGFSANLSQSILDFNLWYRLLESNDLLRQAQAVFIAADQDLIVRTTRAYLDVLRTRDILRFSRAQLRAVAQQRAETQERYKVGLVTVTDVREAQARFSAANADMTTARNALANAREDLAEITGEWPTQLKPLRRQLKLHSPVPADDKHWISAAKRHNPNLQAAESARDAAKDAERASQADYLPKFQLTAARSRDRDGTFNSPRGQFGNAWSAQFEVTLDLFAGGALRATRKRAHHHYFAARDELERVQRATLKNTRVAFRGVQSAISRVKSLRQAVLSSKTAVDANRAAYDVGQRTSVDVLNSISDLFENQQRLTEAEHEYILNHLLLKQAAGLVSTSDIITINQLLADVRPAARTKQTNT